VQLDIDEQGANCSEWQKYGIEQFLFQSSTFILLECVRKKLGYIQRHPAIAGSFACTKLGNGQVLSTDAGEGAVDQAFNMNHPSLEVC